MRLPALLVALLLVTAGVGVSPDPVFAVPDARLTVSAVTVTPTTPLVDERVVLTATVANSPGSPSAVEVTRVDLRAGDERLDRATGVGSLSPGDSVTLPLTARFDEAGQRTLTLVVVGRDEGGETVEVRRPVPVAVERAVPQVDLDVSGLVVDDVARVAVTLSNPAGDPVRNLAVSLSDAPGEARVDRRSVPTLDAGATTVVNLTFVPDAAGDQSLAVDVAYTTSTGTETNRTVETTVAVDSFVDDVGVRVAPAPPDEAEPSVQSGIGGILSGVGGLTDGEEAESDEERERPTNFEVTVTNFGTATVRNVSVEPVTATGALPRVAAPGDLDTGESTTAAVDLSALSNASDVRFVVRYDVGVRAGESEATLPYRPPRGDVRVTDLAIREGPDGTVVVAGNAANVGRGRVTGLVVTALPVENAEPAYPGRDYFVGTIEGSDFAPFEVVVRPTGEVESLSVHLRYQEAGVVTERIVELPYESPVEPESNGLLGGTGPAGSAGSLATSVLFVSLLAALVTFPLLVWRRRR